MAIGHTSKTSGFSTTNGTSYTTASITPTANTLQLAAVVNHDAGGAPGTPTLSGNGLTWVQVDTATFESVASPSTRVTVFRAMGGSPSAGTVSVSIGGASNNVDCLWGFSEFSGVDTTGTNGSGAIVQTAKNQNDSTTSISVTLAALADAANNAVYLAAGFGAQDIVTAGSGYTKIHDPGDATDGENLGTEWKLPGTTSPSISFAVSVSKAAIAIEIKAAGSGAQTLSPGGIASAGALGTATIARGPVIVSPGGVASAQAFGSPVVSGASAQTISGTGGVASAEAFGTPTIQRGAVSVSPAGVVSAETFGAAVVAPGTVVVVAQAIASLQAFGATLTSPGAVLVAPTAIASLQAFGPVIVVPGTAAIVVPGLTSAEAFGVAQVIGGTIVTVHGAGGLSLPVFFLFTSRRNNS